MSDDRPWRDRALPPRPTAPPPPPPSTGYPPPLAEYVTDEANLLHDIRDLLAEIRDLLKPPPPSPRVASFFGYRLGQDDRPTDDQVQMARLFLDGKIGDWSSRLVPVVAFDLAREIIDRSQETCDHSEGCYQVSGYAPWRCVKCHKPFITPPKPA